MSMVVPFPEPEWSWRAFLLIFLVDCWSKKSSSSGSRHCILVHLHPLPTSGLALLASLIGTTCPIHGPPILSLQRYAKLTSVVMKTSTQTSLPWFYSFDNEYGCPLPRAWTVLTSLLADLLGGLLVDKILIIIGLETVYPHPSGPSQLLDLLSLRLLMAHLAQSMALQSSPYKDMQNSQVLSWEQTPKQALILQFWQWVRLSPSPSLNGPDEPLNADLLGGLLVEKNHHHQAWETLHPRPSAPSPDFWTCSPGVS